VAAEYQQQGVAPLSHPYASGLLQRRKQPSMEKGITYRVDRGGMIRQIRPVIVEPRTAEKSRKYPIAKAAISITMLGRTVIREMTSVLMQRVIGVLIRRGKDLSPP
jgi:hypothetical protein